SYARRMSSNANINAVFYADSYHPIQAGSIDGTDITAHDNGVYRALLCATAGLYDPTGDPKVIGDPYCTVFVGHLSRTTTEESLEKEMSKYGQVKNLRLVRHIVTGASRGYAFVEYETDKEMRHAYEAAHHSIIDGSQVIVDYNRQQLMPGWIPRRLGGGLGGRKESGQLRFGGRERPFRAPLRPVPHDELKKLGIPLPPEGRYRSRFQIPQPPRRQSPDYRHGQSAYRSTPQRGDALGTILTDVKLIPDKPTKQSGSSVPVNNEQEEYGISGLKEPTRYSDDVWIERAGDRKGNTHAENDEDDSKHRSKHHHRHKSHKDRHAAQHHERKERERSSEHRRPSNRNEVDDDRWKRRRHEDDYSDFK
ncbi:hypothetical protein KI387_012382, partial [Taxus chinensis]